MCPKRPLILAALSPATPIQPISVPERRFTHMNVDIVGPLPTLVEGFSYVFNMVGRFTR
jgi:transposase InsO family protein